MIITISYLTTTILYPGKYHFDEISNDCKQNTHSLRIFRFLMMKGQKMQKEQNSLQDSQYLLLFLGKIRMQVSHSYKHQSGQKSEFIQNTHIIYTPKIIKFIYPGTRRLNEQEYLERQLQLENLKSQDIDIKMNKTFTEGKRSKVSERKGKIKLMTGKKSPVYLTGKKKHRNDTSQYSESQYNQEMNKTLPLKLPESRNHITTTNFIQNYSCDFFSQCNGAQYIDEGERRYLAFDDSRKTVQQNKKQAKQVGKTLAFQKKEKDESEINGNSLYFKRKNIFWQENLNRTYAGFNTKERSRSRKSIFQPRVNLCDLSFSKDRSTSKRRRIFQGHVSDKSRMNIKSHEQQLEQSKIPKTIFEGWQKFSPESQKDNKESKDFLQTVEQMRIQQSQVRLMA